MIEELIGATSIFAGLTVGTVSFALSAKYKKFSLSFVFLGMSFFSYGLAEIYWYVLDSQGTEPYGGLSDVLYVMYYAFAILHILSTLRALKVKTTIEPVMIVALIMVSLTSVYFLLSVGQADQDMLAYGAGFTVLSSVLVGISAITVIRVYSSILSKSWIFLGFAILISSLVDVWYYTQENLTGYEYGQFPLMDGLWFMTDVMIMAGILIHSRRI